MISATTLFYSLFLALKGQDIMFGYALGKNLE